MTKNHTSISALSRRRFLKNAALGTLGLPFLPGMLRGSPEPSHPNFVFIFIDDMGYGDLSCYGNDKVRTENIDRLASEGIRFTQFYVNAAICSPSRVAVTTGQYPQRWDITSFLARREFNKERGMANYLDPTAPSLARRLDEAGYLTAQVGKWHMGGQRDVGEAPLIKEYGFDISLTQFEGLGDRILATFDTRTWNGSHKQNLGQGSEALGLYGNGEAYPPGGIQWEKRYRVTERFVDRALTVMEKGKRQGRPFYINLWPDDVHTPLEPPPDLRGDGSIEDFYHGVIKELDRQVGRVFQKVRDDEVLRENTWVILASDNGPSHRVGSAGGFRGHKGGLYEGGIREPFIVWSPGLLPAPAAGKINEETVLSGIDLPPTILALAGIDAPAGVRYDGLDMSPAFLGEVPVRETPLMWSRPPGVEGPDGGWPDLAIRDGEWKLLMDEDGSGQELYNLAEDPGESRNLAGKHPEITDRLTSRVLEWYAEVEK